MEALFALNKGQFHQFVTHVSVYHEDCSAPYRRVVDECLVSSGLAPSKFTVWNVPQLSSYLGKALPLDVHGRHVLLDENEALRKSGYYGVLRYALLAAAVRAKEGGKWRYDFVSMNVALAAGCGVGFGALSYGRRRWGWMRRRPVGAVFAAFSLAVASVLMSRAAMKLLGIGLVMAEKGHKKALQRLDCIDCIDDVNKYTLRQIDELREQKLPAPLPGMPPPPAEYVRRFESGIQTQIKMLEVDMEEVRVLRKRMQSHLCTLHKELRAAPDTFVDPEGLPILPSERQAAKERASL